MTDRTCQLDWCGKPHGARGYCVKHVAQIRVRGEIVDQSAWTCSWCGASISHLGTRARFCSVQHKKNAGSARHRQRNPGYYARYTGSPSRLAYAAENRDVLRAKARDYRRNLDPERAAAARERDCQWWRDNKKLHLEYNARKRARSRNAAGSVGVSEQDWQRLMRRHDYHCAYCGAKPPLLHKDHVVPIARGGRHAIGNILPCCPRCNSSKGARLLSDWRYRR